MATQVPEVDQIKVQIKDEFFISMAKKGIHSFVMLGVVQSDGSARLLARVGKTNYVDPSQSQAMLIYKEVAGSGALAFLADEGISRRQDFSETIQHQTYAITYDQAKQFLGLMLKIQKSQFSDPMMRKALVRGEAKLLDNDKLVSAIDKLGEGNIDTLDVDTLEAFNKMEESMKIRCYLPVSEENGEVTFKIKPLSDFEDQSEASAEAKVAISTVNKIQLSNTCRTTALNILECILGFKTDISRYFFISPKYQATLTGGQPKQPFIILPPPPESYTNVSKEQKSVLHKLYKRLEQVSTTHTDDPKTKVKFDKLKALYKNIAGNNTLNANQLLIEIIKHESKELYEKRSPNFLSRLLLIKSTTERVFDQMKTELKKISGPKNAGENEPKNPPKSG